MSRETERATACQPDPGPGTPGDSADRQRKRAEAGPPQWFPAHRIQLREGGSSDCYCPIGSDHAEEVPGS